MRTKLKSLFEEDMLNIVIKEPEDYRTLVDLRTASVLSSHFKSSNINVFAFHKTFPGCIWNKNYEETKDQRMTYEELIELRDFLKKNEIVLVINFDKESISIEEMHDDYCNMILSIFNDGRNIVYTKCKRLKRHAQGRPRRYQLIDSYRNLPCYSAFVLNEDYKVGYSFLDNSFPDTHDSIDKFINDALNNFKELFNID